MIELPYGEKTMTICKAVFIQYQRVTDRRTDTDRIAISISRVSVLTRNKNWILTFSPIRNSSHMSVSFMPSLRSHNEYWQRILSISYCNTVLLNAITKLQNWNKLVCVTIWRVLQCCHNTTTINWCYCLFILYSLPTAVVLSVC